MGIFGTLIGVVAGIAGLCLLVLSLALLVVYPWQLLWVVPLTVYILWWAKRRIFPKRIVLHDRSLLYPAPPKTKTKQHMVEPVTMGGHTRHTHHGHVDGEDR